MSKEEIGTLIVVILKARNLNDKHKFRKQDAFAKATLNGKEQKTKVEPKGGQHPVWDEEFRWPIYQSTDKKSRTLEISCYSKEPREDDLLGTGTIDISDTLRTGEFDDWIPLSMDNVVRGDVYLEMTYYANGPPPPAATPPAAATAAPFSSTVAENISRPPTSKPRPSSSLAVPQPYYNTGGNLMRRPSKLSPADRLSRPSGSPPASYSNARPYPNTPLSPITDEHQRRQSNAQPPANLVPNMLRPGAVPSGIRPVSDPIASANPYLTGAASTARPGTAQPGYQRPAAAAPAPAPTPPSSNPYLSGGSSSTPATVPSIQYNGASTPAPEQYPPQQQQQPAPPPHQPQQPSQQYPPQQQYQQQPQYPQQYQQQQQHAGNSQTPTPAPGGVPSFWNASQPVEAPAGGFSFPMPSVMGGPPPPANGQSSAVTPPIPGAYPATPNLGPVANPLRYGHRRQESDPRDDPALRTRYQTPLPLPPGPPRSAPQSPPAPRSPPLPPAPSYTSSYTPSYAPPPPAPPAVPKSPPRSPRNEVDQMRMAQLKWAEDEAARRREQEIKDMELAMQLDREMNGL